jgi:hypothetical protein
MSSKTNSKKHKAKTVVVVEPKGSRKTRSGQNRKKKVITVEKEQKSGNLLGNIGGAVGGIFGGNTGSAIGKGAGDFISKIFGMGSYTVKSNELTNFSGSVPVFGDSTTTITSREFVQNVLSSTNFTIQSFAINPGLGTLFPWFSEIALRFENYELLGMILEFKSTSGEALNSTNTAQGNVIFATNYDPLEPPFINKQQMDSYQYTTSCAPYGSMIHPIECAPKSRSVDMLYTRTGLPPNGGDLRLFDVANFYLATQGQQADGVTIGELWVSYRVRLLKPRLPPTIGGDSPYLHIRSSMAASATHSALASDSVISVSGLTNITYTMSQSTTSGTLTIPADSRFASCLWYGVLTTNAGGNVGNPQQLLLTGAPTNVTAITNYFGIGGYGSANPTSTNTSSILNSAIAYSWFDMTKPIVLSDFYATNGAAISGAYTIDMYLLPIPRAASGTVNFTELESSVKDRVRYLEELVFRLSARDEDISSGLVEELSDEDHPLSSHRNKLAPPSSKRSYRMSPIG